jgi:citrate synthase
MNQPKALRKVAASRRRSHAAGAADADWLSAHEAARRLDVKVATLYSYVSRGMLHSRREPGARTSRFDPVEVRELRRVRSRHRRDQELTFESAITVLGDDRPFYRGVDAVELAESAGFEEAAELLWCTAEAGAELPWRARTDPTAAADAQTRLPADVTLVDRIEVIVTVLAASDPLRSNTDPMAVPFTARAMIAAIVDALPVVGRRHSRVRRGSVARSLWMRIAPAPPREHDIRLLDSAMVLLADHELAASTVAARVAASVQADPYSVVTAGLGVLRGPVHGGDVRRAEELLAGIVADGSAERVIGGLLQRRQPLPGVGHLAYRGRDGRGDALLRMLRAAYPADPFVAAADAVLDHIARSGLPEANVDLGLAAFTRSAGMLPGAGEAIFAVARIAGWLAHSMEEYRHPTPLRPRAILAEP